MPERQENITQRFLPAEQLYKQSTSKWLSKGKSGTLFFR